MDRIWQWAWDRYGSSYSWAIFAIMYAVLLPAFLMLSLILVAFEKSDRYAVAAAVTAAALPLLVYVYFLPGLGRLRVAEQWAAGRDVTPMSALDATYAASRGAVVRGLAGSMVWFALVSVVVGAIS